MASLNLRGYNVSFPYPTPYDQQKVYMENVLTCLDQKIHAVLESPTGTGKTLCLFAPVTAWAKCKKKQVRYVENEPSEFNANHPQTGDQDMNWGKKRTRVWYTSRTHAQIAQTINEVRKCDTEGLQVTVLGARDQLCINNVVLEEKDSYIKTVKCKELVKGKTCKYYKKLCQEKDTRKYYQYGQVLDIEDFISVGKSNGLCPFFLAKRASETADIVLLPYNYVIEKDSRDANSIYLHNDVIIFDEGHNVPNTCEESYEFSFSSLDIAIGIKNTKELMQTLSKLSENPPEEVEIDLPMHANNALLLLNVLQKLEAGLEELSVSSELLPVSTIYTFFENAGVRILKILKNQCLRFLRREIKRFLRIGRLEISENTSKDLKEAIHNFRDDSVHLNLPSSIYETFKLLEKMMLVVFGAVVRSFDETVIEKSFKCAITIDEEHATNIKKLCLFCFNPSFGIKELLQLGVQSIIITSGTLSPLRNFITELSLPNPITLENGHIAKKCQVPFVILGTGVNNVRMDGAYKNRNNPDYKLSLGMTLTNLISSIPDGVLLLFSSYIMMQNLKEAWESNMGIWTRLSSIKRVFIEPRNKDDFINAMENYRRAIDAGNGAILMGVLRGKISEGMDFKDQYCRGVFIIGVPFPPVYDPRVIGKEKYSESLTIRNPVTNIEEKLYDSYISVEAMRATNQAIGRVIRHGQDYGAIILVDYRFSWPRLFHNISKWLRGSAAVSQNFPATKKLIRDFFRNIHLGKIGVEEIRCQTVDSNGCPIASYVSFEEYDHKKHAPQPVPWIGGSVEEVQVRSKSKSRASRPCGRNNFDFVDEDSPQDLVSKYKNMSTKVFMYGKKMGDWENATSLLDALEQSMSSSVGYREFDKKSSDSCKRKHEADLSQNSKTSPSSLTFPASSEKQNKIPKIKVRPLLPIDKCEELEEPKEDEDLKMKLINYYKTVKQTLSKEHDERFKNISCRYMKGEANLLEVVESMDELFLTSGKPNLFIGFGICVKGKDKELWKNACKMRKVKCEFNTLHI